MIDLKRCKKSCTVIAILWSIILTLVISASSVVIAQENPRLFVLTDIENEPDDAMSMVRLLVYANQIDIEGLAATTSIHQQNKVATWRIKEIVEAYGKVRDNLSVHESGYPTLEFLQSQITEGLPAYGMTAVGEGKDSPASERLIAAADRADDRPLWVKKRQDVGFKVALKERRKKGLRFPVPGRQEFYNYIGLWFQSELKSVTASYAKVSVARCCWYPEYSFADVSS